MMQIIAQQNRPPVLRSGHSKQDAKGRKHMMHIVWGSMTMAAGLFMLVCGSLKSKFIIYRLMVARSKILWGENVHHFYQITGAIVIVFGALVALGYI